MRPAARRVRHAKAELGARHRTVHDVKLAAVRPSVKEPLTGNGTFAEPRYALAWTRVRVTRAVPRRGRASAGRRGDALKTCARAPSARDREIRARDSQPDERLVQRRVELQQPEARVGDDEEPAGVRADEELVPGGRKWRILNFGAA